MIYNLNSLATVGSCFLSPILANQYHCVIKNHISHDHPFGLPKITQCHDDQQQLTSIQDIWMASVTSLLH